MRIVAETLEPAASTSEVARRRQVCAQQVFGWSRQARLNPAVRSVGSDERSEPSFVPLVPDAAAPAKDAVPVRSSAVIEITVASAAVWVASVWMANC